jgi:N-acyl amino acid synthase of PEP-CTERM/exosortase system
MALKFVNNIKKLIELHRMNLASPYHEYFKMVLADNDELRNQSFKLRYEVYCDELGWEEPANFPDGLESDEFDPWSEHCLLFHRSTDQYAGTVRLVKTHPDFPDQGIPMVAHYDGEFWDTPHNPHNMPLGSYGEISRLALLHMFRKRAGERETPDGQGQELFEWSQTERRRFPHIALGLYLSAATAGLSQGMTGVYAMMEPRLARHLRFAGIKFEQVGDPIEFRGKRAPYYISRDTLLKSLVKPLRGLLYAIADDLKVNLKKRF